MATSDEYKRFVSNAPESQREIRTIQISHADLDQDYYYVQDYVDFTATTENDELITFSASSLSITEPAERNDSEQNLQVNMGAVTDELQDIIDQITDTGFLSELQITYRKYYSEDLTAPAVTPLVLFGSTISFEGSEAVTFSAEDSDLTNKRAGLLYTLALFPGLETA